MDSNLNKFKNRINPFSKILRLTISSGSAFIVTQALMMGYALLVARWLKPEVYGVISACYAAATLFSFFVNWGVDSWLLRQSAIEKYPMQLLGDVLLSKLILGLIWSLALWLGLRLIQPGLYEATILAIVIIDTLFDAIFNCFLGVWTGIGNIRQALVFLVTSRALRFLSALFLILFGIKSLFIFTLIRFVCTLIMVIIVWMIAKPQIKGSFFNRLVQIYKSALSFSASDFLTLVYTQLDVNLLAFTIGEQGLIGNYSVVISLVNALLSIPAGIYNILLPRIFRQRSEGQSQYQNTIKELYFILTGIGIGSWVLLSVFGKSIVGITLGDPYQETAMLLLIISPIFILKAINYANSALFVANNLQSERLKPQLFVVIIKLVLGIMIVPVAKAVGLVWLGILCEFLLLIGYLQRIVIKKEIIFPFLFEKHQKLL